MQRLQKTLRRLAAVVVASSRRQPPVAEILVADVAEGGGRVSARLDVRDDGRRGARRGGGEEGEGEVAVVAVSPV